MALFSLGSAFKSGANKLTNKGSGGEQGKAAGAAAAGLSPGAAGALRNSNALSGSISSAFGSGASKLSGSIRNDRKSGSINKASSGSLSSGGGTYSNYSYTQPSAFQSTLNSLTQNSVPTSPTIGVAGTLAGTNALQLPVAPAVKDASSEMAYGNVALGLNPDGSAKTTEQQTQEQTTPKSAADTIYATLGIAPPEAPQSSADLYLKAEKQFGINKLQKQVADYQAQLNAITSKAQADQLSLVGQGRGIPEAIIGGQQAQIGREAAIAALPIQAQLSASQGNLELAQNRLDTYFKLVSEDIQNKYAYDNKLFDTVYDYATKQQQQKIDELRDEKNFQRQKELAALNFSYDSMLKDIGISTKPLTDTQNTALGYADRLTEANNVIEDIGSKFAGLGSYIGQILPNALKLENRQLFEQAQRNFVNAVLRRESGAVISDSEFNNAKKQYFPQPGDSDAVLKQKSQNRSTIINNFYRSAGTQQTEQQITRPEDLRTKYNY